MKYSNFRQMMTGFLTSEEHATFGHWTNPEYQALQSGIQTAACETCRDTGSVQTEKGAAICVDCCLGIPLEDAKIVIRDYEDCESFVCAHYEFYSNGQGDNSSDLAKYWQRCKEIVENIDSLPY